MDTHHKTEQYPLVKSSLWGLTLNESANCKQGEKLSNYINQYTLELISNFIIYVYRDWTLIGMISRKSSTSMRLVHLFFIALNITMFEENLISELWTKPLI